MDGVVAQRLPVSDFRPSWNRRIETGGSRPEEEQQRAKVIYIGTAESLQREVPDEYKVIAHVFVSADLKLQALKPVTIRVTRGDDLWFAENDRLDVYATGESPLEAIAEFEAHLLNFYQHYRALDSAEAMGQALELKRLFQEGFREASK